MSWELTCLKGYDYYHCYYLYLYCFFLIITTTTTIIIRNPPFAITHISPEPIMHEV